MTEIEQKIRSEHLDGVKRLVIKVGSKLLVSKHSHRLGVNQEFITELSKSISLIRAKGIEVVLVSSGSVGVGMSVQEYEQRPKDLGIVQACASMGQVLLMEAYHKACIPLEINIGQVLLSADDFRNRDRYNNISTTVESLLEIGALPIINENDTVAVEEIKVGDNDKLSADVAQFLNADLLMIFTDEKGLYDTNPKTNPDAKIIKVVHEITDDVLDLAEGDKGSEVSTGGMQTKLEALRQATSAGCAALLAHGFEVLPHEILEGKDDGSFFVASDETVKDRDKWLGFVSSPSGWVEIDAGAQKALEDGGTSLLLMGVRGVEGYFRSGELLEIKNADGEMVARGQSNHDAATLTELIALPKAERKKLDNKMRVVVHRNNLVMIL